MTAPAILGTVATYEDLHYILRLRADALGVSRETIDENGHFAEGYASKTLRNDPKLRIGWWCLGDMLAVLGLRLVVIEQAKAPVRLKKRNPSKVRNGRMCTTEVHRFLKRIGVKGGTLSRRYMSKQQAQALARRAAQIRWANRAAGSI
jgi:hypothetical protein